MSLITGSLLLALASCTDESGESRWFKPELTLSAPAVGQTITGDTVTVRGHVKHLDRVTVNGVEVNPNALGNFELELPLAWGVNQIEARGSRKDGEERFDRRSVLAGQFRDARAPVESGLAMRVNQGGLDRITAMVRDQIDPETVSREALRYNPILDEDTGFYSVHATLDSLSFSTLKVKATPSAAGLRVSVAVPNPSLAVSCSGQVLGESMNLNARLRADEVSVTLDLALGAAGGKPTVDVSAVDVRFSGLDVDSNSIPSLIEDLVVDAAAEAAERALEQVVQTVADSALDEAFTNLDLSFSTDLRGHKLELGLAFAQLSADDQGLFVVADVSAGFAGTVIQPGEGALLGQATGLPTLSTDADLALALSDTLVNHLLYQAWRSGLMQIELSTQDGTLNGGMADKLKAESATVSLRSDLPPVVTSATGGMRLDAAGLEVTIDTPGGDLGDHMVIDGSVNLLMDPQGADGWLNLGLGTPSMTLMVRENNWGASAEATTNLLEDMLPVEDLMAPMGTFSVPIPTVSKAFGVSGLTLGREQGWTRVGVGLE